MKGKESAWEGIRILLRRTGAGKWRVKGKKSAWGGNKNLVTKNWSREVEGEKERVCEGDN